MTISIYKLREYPIESHDVPHYKYHFRKLGSPNNMS